MNYQGAQFQLKISLSVLLNTILLLLELHTFLLRQFVSFVSFICHLWPLFTIFNEPASGCDLKTSAWTIFLMFPGAEGCMGPVVMPPGKKAEGPSSGSVARGLSQLYEDTEAADLSLALSTSLSRAEDEELTSLSWLHESTDLLTSLGQSGLRSVSPLQDANGGREPSSSSPSSSPEPSEPSYHLSTGPSRKPPYSFSCLIFMAIEDAPSKRLPVKDIYGWILEHFPYFASAPTGWKNSVRHNLSLNKCFKKVDKDRSQVWTCFCALLRLKNNTL